MFVGLARLAAVKNFGQFGATLNGVAFHVRRNTEIVLTCRLQSCEFWDKFRSVCLLFSYSNLQVGCPKRNGSGLDMKWRFELPKELICSGWWTCLKQGSSLRSKGHNSPDRWQIPKREQPE